MSKLLISAQVLVWGFEVHLLGLQTSDLRRIATLSLSINLILCLYSRTLIFTVVFDVVLNWFFFGGYIPYPFFKEIEHQRRAWMQPWFCVVVFWGEGLCWRPYRWRVRLRGPGDEFFCQSSCPPRNNNMGFPEAQVAVAKRKRWFRIW